MDFLKLDMELFEIMDPVISDSALGAAIRAAAHYAKGTLESDEEERLDENEVGYIYLQLLIRQIDQMKGQTKGT